MPGGRKLKFTPDKIEWLKQNYNKTYKEMSEYLGICEETIRVTINELGLKRTTRYRPFKLNMSDLEFLADLDNPRLTAPDIVEKYKDKYGIGESRIHQLRKVRGIKLQVNTLSRVSRPEKLVMEALDRLDYAYIRERSIGKYHIDFYLGHKKCIEVQGIYWHNRPERKEKDARKKLFLESNDYQVLYIWEDDMSNLDERILCFINQGLPVLKDTENNLVEPCKRRVIRRKS